MSENYWVKWWQDKNILGVIISAVSTVVICGLTTYYLGTWGLVLGAVELVLGGRLMRMYAGRVIESMGENRDDTEA